ncbi:MAG: type II toxin-antitoxin system VapC family toxin [Deltaproteobacteria bacterium]|nr:type II toxin-antitoxin system VapC family toxin [Deltaproteobacteria bacterium]
MRKLVIDTNALISFVTDRNPAQQEKIAAVFEDAAQLKVAILCPQNVLTEFVYVLEKIYKQPKGRICSMITDFMALPGVQVVNTVDFEVLLRLWPDKIADFGDAIVAVVCKAEKGARIVTFDARFIRALHSMRLNTVDL